MKKRPTQADVAKLAGVSRSTVSNVFNEGRMGVSVSERARKRVLMAAEQLGYTPDPIAQMLARGDRSLLGLFTYESDFPYDSPDFYHQFLVGVEREAGERGYNIILFTSDRGNKRRIFNEGINQLHLADGAIIMGAKPDRAELKSLYDEGYPFVYIGRREVPGCAFDWVVSDYPAASAEATRHLLALGHRHIGLITHLDHTFEPTQDRLRGCKKAAKEVNARIFVMSETEVRTPRKLQSAIKRHGLTALMCMESSMARFFAHLCAEIPLRVPEDVSIVSLGEGMGIDTTDWSFTRILLNRDKVGEMAARVLIKRLQGFDGGPQRIYTPCDFVVGETTAPPRGAAAPLFDKWQKEGFRERIT